MAQCIDRIRLISLSNITQVIFISVINRVLEKKNRENHSGIKISLDMFVFLRVCKLREECKRKEY